MSTRDVPPGTTKIELPDIVQAGDYFFYERLEVWMPCPKSAVGQSCVGLMARGKVDFSKVDSIVDYGQKEEVKK